VILHLRFCSLNNTFYVTIFKLRNKKGELGISELQERTIVCSLLTSVSSSVVFPLNIACSLMIAKPLRTGDFLLSSTSSVAGDLLLDEVARALLKCKLVKLKLNPSSIKAVVS
jgi:hypothetical protein